MERTANAALWRLLLAFAAVYTIWGSTYLAIYYAVGTLPPFLMGGARFIIAGVILFVVARARGAVMPTRLHWRSAMVVGALLLLGGNGGVMFAEQYVPSGLASLMVAAMPLWVVVLDWLRPGGKRPSLLIAFGVLLGTLGIFVLVDPAAVLNGQSFAPIGILALMISTFCWASGSLYSRQAALPASPLMSTAAQMLSGGLLMTLVGTFTGEWPRLDLAQVSTESWLAFFYLIVFGSIIGFTSYIYLLNNTTPARAVTYAYVNPVVAVFLGWAIAGEAITDRTILAAAIIISAVILINTYRSAQQARPAPRVRAAPS